MFCSLAALALSSCSSTTSYYPTGGESYAAGPPPDFAARMGSTIGIQEKVIVVDPSVHAWAAYENGTLVKAGQASSGADFCPDIGRACRTTVGSFRIQSLGSPDCVSRKFPIGRGGSPMPYCMYFTHGIALHGVPENEVGEGNFSHGCVRMHVSDAEWVRYEFANVGTKVIVKSY